MGVMGDAGEILGRDGELASLLAEIAPVRAEGRSIAVGVVAEAGVGKTALLHELTRRSGIRSWWISGREHDQAVPMGVVGQLLRTVPRSQWVALDATDRATLDAVLGHGATVGLLPVIRAVVALLSAVAASEPVLVVIDDAHWVDPASQEVLAEALPRIEGDAVGILLATRPVPGPLAAAVRTVTLAGLPAEASRELGQRLGLAAPVAAELAGRTGGNPLATIAVARSLSAEQRRGQVGLPRVLELGPRLIDAYGAALAELPPDTRVALTVLAVADGTPTIVLERALAGSGVGLDALAPAHAAGLLDDTTFGHPLIRAAVIGSAEASELVAAHRAVAEALVPAADPERWAWHVAESTAYEPAVVAAAMAAAGDAAIGRGARVAAARY